MWFQCKLAQKCIQIKTVWVRLKYQVNILQNSCFSVPRITYIALAVGKLSLKKNLFYKHLLFNLQPYHKVYVTFKSYSQFA